MTRAIVFFAACLIPVAAQAPTNPLAAVHSVFVQGNSEVASAIRKELERQAKVFPQHNREVCLSLAVNPKDADAILDIQEQAKLGGIIAGPGVTASGMLTNHEGDMLWSDAKSGDNGMIHSGAGGAAQFLLQSLEKKVCPKWHHL